MKTFVCKIIFLFYKRIFLLFSKKEFIIYKNNSHFELFYIFLPFLLACDKIDRERGKGRERGRGEREKNAALFFSYIYILYLSFNLPRSDWLHTKKTSIADVDECWPPHSQRLFYLFNLSLYASRGPLVGSHVRRCRSFLPRSSALCTSLIVSALV